MKNIFVIIATAISFGSMVQAEKVSLDFAYMPNKTYSYSQKVDMNMEMPNPLGGGENMSTVSEVGLDTELVTSTHEKGVQVTMSFKKMVMDSKMNGVSMMTYDSSAEDAAASPVAAMLKPLNDLEVVSYFTEEGDFLEVEEGEAQAALQIAGFSPDQFEQMVDPSVYIPEGEVEVGDTWESTQALPMGNLSQEAKEISMTCKFEGMESVDGVECAKISYTSEIDLVFSEAGQTLRMKSNTFKGAYWHDNELKMTRKTTLYADMVMSPPADAEIQEGGLGEIPYKMRTEVTLRSVK